MREFKKELLFLVKMISVVIGNLVGIILWLPIVILYRIQISKTWLIKIENKLDKFNKKDRA